MPLLTDCSGTLPLRMGEGRFAIVSKRDHRISDCKLAFIWVCSRDFDHLMLKPLLRIDEMCACGHRSGFGLWSGGMAIAERVE